MPETIIDWSFSAEGAQNADGSRAGTVSAGVASDGPGASALGARRTAMAFGPSTSCEGTISPGELDGLRFVARVLFRAPTDLAERQTLLECSAVPFSISIEPGASADTLQVIASVTNGAVGPSPLATERRISLQRDAWHCGSLVYDTDTLALLIEDRLVAISAFPRGGLRAGTSERFCVGAALNGVAKFSGAIAGLQIWHDIPEAIETTLDASRGGAEWQLTRKANELRERMNLGTKQADFYRDEPTQVHLLPFERAVISYQESAGVAFEMHGSILTKWRSDENLRRALGALCSDESDAGGHGERKSAFVGGTIYAGGSGTFAVSGRISLDYEALGGPRSYLGLPTADTIRIAGGQQQSFQTGMMYCKQGAPCAFEVHGAILQKLQAEGGIAKWGFPLSNEQALLDGSNKVVGRRSEFERCSIYWSPRTPACIVYGAIREKYIDLKGHMSELGFPTSDELDVPGAPSGSRGNSFEHGSLLWLDGRVTVCVPFNVYLGRLDTREEDRDILDADGQNDLWLQIRLLEDGREIFSRRLPESGHLPSGNIRELAFQLPVEVTPNDLAKKILLSVTVFETDDGQAFGGGSANLGELRKELHAANAWGLRESPNGLFHSESFGAWINFLDWSLKPKVTAATPFDGFGAINRGTPTIDFNEYAAAFADVGTELQLSFDVPEQALKRLYYECFVKPLAKDGNCFGMSLETIYAWKGMSRLGRPLARFVNWPEIENDFNVRQAYQLGADCIWWFVSQFVSGNTHNPVGVFQGSWDAFQQGNHPVLCIAQNYDFSGAAHCIMPTAWRRDRTPWEIECIDPNVPGRRTTLFVDPTTNTYRYQGSGARYSGGAWEGGRLQYFPWSVLNHRQRTPIWDAFALFLALPLFLVGDAADVQTLRDERGNDIDSDNVKSRAQLEKSVVRIPGVSGAGVFEGAMLVGPGRKGAAVQMTMRGSKRATLHSGLKHGLHDVSFEGPVAIGEMLAVTYDKLGTRDAELRIGSDRQRSYSVAASARIGGVDDRLDVRLDQIPGDKGLPARISLHAASGVLDVLSPGSSDGVLTVRRRVGGKEAMGRFEVPLQGGTRIELPAQLDNLRVGAIDNLRGNARSFRSIRPK